MIIPPFPPIFGCQQRGRSESPGELLRGTGTGSCVFGAVEDGGSRSGDDARKSSGTQTTCGGEGVRDSTSRAVHRGGHTYQEKGASGDERSGGLSTERQAAQRLGR